MKSYCLLFFSLILTSLIAQPLVEFDFDNCLTPPTGYTFTSGPSTGCICAYEGDGVEFDGVSDFVAIDGVDSFFLNKDFTLSFLFSPDPAIRSIQTLVSRSDTCFNDNTFEVRYDGMDNRISLDLFQSDDVFINLSGRIDPDLCWHQFVFRREEDRFQLILDGELEQDEFVNGGVNVVSSQPFRIADGPCVGTISDRFAGVVDELVFDTVPIPRFNFSVLGPAERIVNRDTVIFRGEIIDAQTITNCATAVQWSPPEGISSTTDFNPLITTDTTVTYIARFTADRCSTVDTLRIIVLQDGDIECSELRLPTAFTPNGDGLNDDYGISNTFITDSNGQFEIFARNGALVFTAEDLSSRWDGRWRGDGQLRPGTYIYKIKYTCQGESFLKTGSLSVLR